MSEPTRLEQIDLLVDSYAARDLASELLAVQYEVSQLKRLLQHATEAAQSSADEIGRLRAALEPLLAQFDAYQESGLSHADAHNLLVRYPLWEAARAALATPTTGPHDG